MLNNMSFDHDNRQFTAVSHSVEETNEIARELADIMTGGETLLLNGELGAGKTTFTKAFFKCLGVAETVTSPTFTIMKTYSGKFIVHHLDMYRIFDESEVEELGLREEIGENDITVIEWNKFSEFFGTVYTVDIEYRGENERNITIKRIQE